jgi:hypothetical protein
VSYLPSLSGDGRFVAFTSFASNLVSSDGNGSPDVFLRDRQLSATEILSVSSAGSPANNGSYFAAASAHARQVAFESFASNLVDGDSNGGADVFVRDLGEIGTSYCTSSVNSTGSAAEISASGSASAAAGDLELSAFAVPHKPGIFVHGSDRTELPFGNGFLCTRSGIARGAVTQPTGNVAQYVYDNSDPLHSVAAFVNTTRNFQYWFRDPAGGGTFFNTSNAISIAILP